MEIDIEIDSSLMNRSLRNCLAHYGLVEQVYNASISLLQSKENEKVNALNQIFSTLKTAFDEVGIDGFPCEPYDIRAFDNKGNRLMSYKISMSQIKNTDYQLDIFDEYERLLLDDARGLLM